MGHAAPPLPFVRLAPPTFGGPVVVAVPHAGRLYPASLLAQACVGRPALETLEDRYADLLAADAAGVTLFVAHYARAWIDLNRHPREIDPAMVAPPPPDTIASAKVRGGLGLIPRRIAGRGEIYPAPLSPDDVRDRVESSHTPWHAALA
ncbi:MAG: N-formylglutamate amidohydrolase, partial [Sphingomonadales bacterium]